MKKLILPLCLFCSLICTAQKIKQFYDWNWKPCDKTEARFLSEILATDSGWYRNDYYIATGKLQMTGLYNDSACKIMNGYFTYYHPNGNVSSVGQFVSNRKKGLWLSYHYNGKKSDSTVYRFGYAIGTAISFYSNGIKSDSSFYDKSDAVTTVSWFDNGQLSSMGKRLHSKKDGEWKYYHKNGNIASVEEYEQDKLVSKIYYEESGAQLTDTINKDRRAMFAGGPLGHRKYMMEHLKLPKDYKAPNNNPIAVVVQLLIDEDGNVEEAYVYVPSDPALDKIALDAMEKSPKWTPAISNNRRVKMINRQVLFFSAQSTTL